MQKQQKMETASRDDHFFFLLTFEELTSIAHRRWIGEVRELRSRHFIYFTSSDFHTTCIFPKRKGENQNIRCLTQDHSVADNKLGILLLWAGALGFHLYF